MQLACGGLTVRLCKCGCLLRMLRSHHGVAPCADCIRRAQAACCCSNVLRRTGKRPSELSMTISTYADKTACPAPSCRTCAHVHTTRDNERAPSWLSASRAPVHVACGCTDQSGKDSQTPPFNSRCTLLQAPPTHTHTKHMVHAHAAASAAPRGRRQQTRRSAQSGCLQAARGRGACINMKQQQQQQVASRYREHAGVCAQRCLPAAARPSCIHTAHP